MLSVKTDDKNLYKRKQLRIDLFCYGLMLLPIIHFILFWVIVNIDSYLLPFQNDLTGEFTWSNFEYIFSVIAQPNSPLLLCLFNTLKYFITSMISAYGIGLLFAYFIHKKIRGYKAFTVIFMLPHIVSASVMVALYKNVISSAGPIASIYYDLTGNYFPAFLYDDSTATNTIILYTILMGFGNNLILFSGSMANVSADLYESASIDGAGIWRQFFSITLPMISPTLMMMLLFSSMGVLASSGPILLFT